VAAPPFLRSYYLYQVTASCSFFNPIFFVYYEERAGLSLATILWLQSYFLGVRALLDVPLGALADRYSRRASLAAYALCQMAGAALVLAFPSFAGVFAAETLFALAGASKSGADSALLFDGLKAAGRLDLYPSAESRTQALVSLSFGITAAIGGFLAAADLRLPYLATVVVGGASAVFVLLFGESGEAARVHASLGTILRDAGRCTARSPAVRWVMALACYTVVASHAYYYLQQPYLRAVGVPLALFGVAFAATKVVTAMVSSGAHRVDLALGPRATTAVMTVTPVLGLGAMSVVASPAGAFLLLARGLLDGLWVPLLNLYMNRLVDSRLRATMLSAQSLVSRLSLAGALALLGVGTARVGLAATLALTAAAAAVVGTALAVVAPRALGEEPVLAAEEVCDSRNA
jgi:hypothetical protein